jgi:hypothetical protein
MLDCLNSAVRPFAGKESEWLHHRKINPSQSITGSAYMRVSAPNMLGNCDAHAW